MVETKEFPVKLGSGTRLVRIPSDPDNKMEHYWDKHGQKDSFFPFWLEIWPCSFGLFEFFLDRKIDLDHSLEIGCGCGVLAQLLTELPGEISHSDIVPDACATAQAELRLRGSSRRVFAMDFNQPGLEENFPVIFGGDLFYDNKMVEGICRFVDRYLSPGGTAYFADPLRAGREHVPGMLAASGLAVEQITWNYRLDDAPRSMAVWVLRRKA